MNSDDDLQASKWLSKNKRWFYERRQKRVLSFTSYVGEHLHLQLAIRQITTVQELVAIACRHRFRIDHADVLLFYRQWDQTFWPWHGMPTQVRKHFAHVGRLPSTKRQASQ